MKTVDVIIIGAGAAGLMCAFNAAKRGRRVLLLEQANKAGKKILMSGGGRCNFTNLYIDPECYLSSNPHFCKSALNQYTQWDFIRLVEKHGIAYHEKQSYGASGELFCKHSSKQILQMLLHECDQAGVIIKMQCSINTVELFSAAYKVVSNQGQWLASSLVIATGGLSMPKMGATGLGYQLAQQFGLNVLPTRAGLVPLTFSDAYKVVFERLSGIAVATSVGNQQTSINGNILFTHRGLSGPAILQLSSYWQPGQAIEINLMPEFNAESYLFRLKKQSPQILLKNALAQQYPKKLLAELQQLFWSEQQDWPLQQFSQSQLNTLAYKLSHWSVKPSGTEGYRTAEVTLGGVDTHELSSKTMQSKQHPGLFFIGEVVDVTGHLGGFNFQWAWSSAYAAAQYC